MTYFFLAIGLALASSVASQSAWSMSDDQVLEQRLKELETARPAVNPDSWRHAASSAEVILRTQAPATNCDEARRQEFAGRYVITWDSTTGRACRMYDLSFPTLVSSTTGMRVSHIPVQRLTSRDFRNWIDGNYDAVLESFTEFRSNFDSDRAARESWVSQLRFRRGATPRFLTSSGGATGKLPASFKASDLDAGSGFRFVPRDRRRLKELLNAVRAARQESLLESNGPVPEEYWAQVVDDPRLLLEKIQFNWDDAQKVYEVVIDGDFLPLIGPVAVLDYEKTYKQALQRFIRSIVGSALRSVVGYVPHPVVRNVLDIAVTDTFEFIELMYAYQMNQLEDTLRAGLESGLSLGLEDKLIRSSLDIVYGTRSDLVTNYIMALAQGRRFDWAAVEKIGRRLRYSDEKSRDIMLSNLHNRLVQKENCTVQIVYGNFGTCTRDGKTRSLHSLMSEPSVLFWSLGAPMVHRYGSASEVLIKRAASWTLAVGIRLVDIPFVGFLKETFAGALKSYAVAGMLDEAYLRNRLRLRKESGQTLTAEEEKILDWLYRQNINPFMPKSMESEANLINAQRAAMTSSQPLAGR